MDRPVATPSNLHLRRQPDRHWPRVLTSVLLASGALFVALLLVGWPRLRATSVNYDLIRLRAEVEQLRHQQRALELQLEGERNPVNLAARATLLGLAPPSTALALEEVTR